MFRNQRGPGGRSALSRRAVVGVAAIVVGSIAAVGPVAAQIAPVEPLAAATPATLIIDGRGNGHGIGLSQYGALGYSIDEGWSADQILAHYYGGTTPGLTDPAAWITVRLTELDDLQTAVVHPKGLATTPSDPVAGRTWGSIAVREIGPSTYRVWGRATQVCPAETDNLDDAGNGWTLIADGATPRVDIDPPIGSEASENVDDLLAVCQPNGVVRSYRGSLFAVNGTDAENRTVNEVPIEQYLRSVVGSEVPASWATAGGGRGIEAIKAQAVAARSYALTQNRYSYARTCDTQACQVYSGAARRSAVGAPPTRLEFPGTDQGVSAMAGVVRLTSGGAIANTMFSSSSGGWTAPTTSPGFPAVEDLGDDTASNPHHRWTVNAAAAALESTWPQIGSFERVVVTKRNGLGEWGGRVLTAVISGSGVDVTVTGDDLRRALGLRSNWFSIRSICPAGEPPAGNAPMASVSGLRYTAISPTRVVDTRNGIGSLPVPVPGSCTLSAVLSNRPAGAVAAAVTITTTRTLETGFITSYPCGTRRPNTSAIQTLAGLDVPGTTIVPLGADGSICLFTSTTTDLIIDVLGWLGPQGTTLQTSIPTRIVDTRSPLGAPSRPAGSITRVTVPAGIAAGATAVSVNLTATATEGAGFVTAYPCESTRTDTSVLNVRPFADVANRALMPLGADRSFCLWTSVPTHLIVDIDGWFVPIGGATVRVDPAGRAVDTRNGIGLPGPLAAGQVVPVDIGEATTAALVQVTAVDSAAAGFITMFPCAASVPNASVLNSSPQRNVANLVVMPTDSSGRLCVVSSMNTHLLIDVLGRAE